jgi:hypothetical protein
MHAQASSAVCSCRAQEWSPIAQVKAAAAQVQKWGIENVVRTFPYESACYICDLPFSLGSASITTRPVNGNGK